jgi:hypothetical protein
MQPEIRSLFVRIQGQGGLIPWHFPTIPKPELPIDGKGLAWLINGVSS